MPSVGTFRYFRSLPSASTVGAGNTATIKVPIGSTYRGFIINVENDGTSANEATMKTIIKKVRLMINGIARWDVSAKTLIDCIRKYQGKEFEDGKLVLPLSRNFWRKEVAEDNLAWGTLNVDTFDIEIDVDSTAVSPKIKGSSLLDPVKRNLGTITEIHEFNRGVGIAGKVEVSELPTGLGDLMTLHVRSANCTDLELQLNQVPFVNCGISDMHTYLKEFGNKVPQSGYIHVDPTILNRVDDRLPLYGVSDFRVKMDMSDAEDFVMIMETLNQPLGTITD